jgi:hypothetical protein
MKKKIFILASVIILSMTSLFTSSSSIASGSDNPKVQPNDYQKHIFIILCNNCDYMWATPCNVFQWHCPRCGGTNVSVVGSTPCFY